MSIPESIVLNAYVSDKNPLFMEMSTVEKPTPNLVSVTK